MESIRLIGDSAGNGILPSGISRRGNVDGECDKKQNDRKQKTFPGRVPQEYQHHYPGNREYGAGQRAGIVASAEQDTKKGKKDQTGAALSCGTGCDRDSQGSCKHQQAVEERIVQSTVIPEECRGRRRGNLDTENAD